MNTPPAVSAIPRYRQILRRELPDHYFKADHRYLLWLPFHVGVIAVSLWLLHSHFSWWFAPVLGLVIGHSFGCGGFLAHEICHGGAIKNRKLRHFLAGFAFSPFGIGPYLWSRWHNGEHHGNTQHAELDPDRLFLIDEYKHNPVLKSLYKLSPIARNLVIFGFFSMMMTQHNISMIVAYMKDPKSTKRDKATILFQFLLTKVAWIVGTAFLGWKVLLFGYFMPLMVANAIVISYIATNHFLNPIADEDDVLASSLSVTLPRWLQWLDILHLRFGAHVAHHLFPQVPARYGREIEAHVARLWPDRFHVMPFGKALKLLWQTPWVYHEDGDKLIDPEKGFTTSTLGRGLEMKLRSKVRTKIRSKVRP